MPEGSNIGNLYYTVSIDRASLEKVRRDLRALGEAAEKSAPGVTKIERAMGKLGEASKQASGASRESGERFQNLVQDLRVLESSVQDTVNMFRSGRMTVEQFTGEMTVFGQLAEGMRNDLTELGQSAEGASIDQAKMSRALRDTSSVMDNVRQKTEKLGVEYKDVESRFETLTAKAKELRRDLSTVISRKDITEPEEYAESLKIIDFRAEALNSELDELRGTMGRTAEGSARISGRTAELANTQAKARKEFGLTRGAMESVNASMSESDAVYMKLTARAEEYTAEIRSVSAALDTSSGNTEENKSKLNFLLGTLRGIQTEMSEYAQSTQMSTDATKRHHSQTLKINSALRKAERSLEKNTGAMTRQAMASNLSYGGLSLLQDRIFQISPALGIFTNQLMFTERGLKAMLATMAPVLAVAGSLIAVLGSLAASVKAGSELETALANVRKTTNLSSDALGRLTQSFQETSKEIPVTVQELLEMAQVAGQLGIVGAENVERFSDTVARLAIATDVTGEQGATNLARFLQATGTAMDDMGTEAERVSNVLNQLENTTAATAAEILQMTSYTQGLSSQAGFTTDEILALNASLLSLGVKAEAGGSAVVRTMAKIQEAASAGSSELVAFAENAGMTTEEFGELVDNSPLDALVALSDGMAATSDAGGNLNDVLNELNINEVRERRTLLALAQGHETLKGAIEESRRESFLMNSLNAEVQIQSETLSSQVQLLKNRFIEFAQDLGNRTVPMVKALNGALINLVDVLNVLTPLIVGFGASLGARALIFGIQKLTAGIGAMTAAAGAAAGVIPKLAAAMKIAMGPMGWVSLGIGVVVAGVGAFNRFRNSVDDSTGSINKNSEAAAKMADEFARVENEVDLTYALEATSDMLEGKAAEAWNTYTTEIQEALDKGMELDDALEDILEKLGQIGRAPLFQDVVGAAVDAKIQIDEMGDVLSEATDVDLQFDFDTPEDELREIEEGLTADLRDLYENIREENPQLGEDFFENLLSAPSELAVAEGEGLIQQANAIGLVRQEVLDLLDARQKLDAFESSSPFFGEGAAGTTGATASAGGGGDVGGAATGGGRAPGDFDPIADIIEQREDEIDRLEILINKYGRDTAFAFTQGLIDAQEEAGNAFVDFVSSVADRSLELVDGEWVEKLIPKESFIQQIQEAGGTDEAGNFLVSTAEATEEAMEMLERAGEEASGSFRVMDIRISDLAAGMDRFVSDGLEPVEEAFEEGIIGPIGRAERRVDFHRELFNTLSGQYGEFSEAAQLVKGRLEEEEATLAGLTATEQERQESQREMTQQQEAVAQAVSDRIVAEVSLGSQLSNNKISQEDYYRKLIEVKQAELDAKVAKNGVTQETIELEAEIINLNDALDDEISRQEELRQAMDDTAAARQSAAEVTRDYHTELARGASVGMDVARARGDQLATQMELNELLEFGVITQEQYNQRLLQSKQRLLEYAVQNGFTSEWVLKLKMEVDNLSASMEKNNSVSGASTGVLSELADGFRSLADAAEAAGNEAGASFLNFLGSLTEQAPNVASNVNRLRDGIDEYDDSIEFTAKGNREAVNSIMGGISGIASALSALVPQQNSAANSMVEGFFSVGGSIAELVTGIPGLGKIMGSVGKIVSGVLGDMSNGVKEVRQNLEKMAESMQYVTKATAKGFADIEGATERVSRGGILGWFGATKEAIDEEVMKMVQNVADGISNGLGDALTAGFRAALTGEGDWKKEFRNSLEDAMLDLVIETLVNSAILDEDGPFQEFIAEFTRIMAEEGPAAAMAYANKELPGVMDETQGIVEEGTAFLPDIFKIGSDAVIGNTKDNIDRLTEHIQDNYSYMTDEATQSLIDAATKSGEITRGALKGATFEHIDQEMLNNMLAMADSIMSGIQGAMKKGMRSAMAGDQDWKKELKSGVLSAIGDTVMDAFIKQAIIQGIMADFVAGFVKLWEEGDYEGANQYIRDNLDSTIDRVGDVIDTFINAIPPELREDFLGGDDDDPTPAPKPAPKPDTGGPRDAGTRIGEITGPTRDLLLDLLRPLSILPSWTSMIRDIRNDVRAISASGGISITPDTITTPESLGTITNVENQTINITNPTITTKARSIKELYRELSEYASKQKKGGRK